MSLLLFFSGFPLVLIPLLGPWFRIPNTLIHEMGHALVALMFRGEVLEIQLKPNAAGLAKTKGSGFVSFLVALAGYPLAAVFAMLSVRWSFEDHSYLLLYAFVIAALIALMLWLRDAVSILIALILIVTSFSLAWFGGAQWVKIFGYVLAGWISAASLFSSWIVLRMSFTQAAKSGDAIVLKELSKIPAWFWGVFFMLGSLYAFLCSLRYIPCVNRIYAWFMEAMSMV